MKTKSFFLLILWITVLYLIFHSCQHEPENYDLLPEVCFEGEILPIFQGSCALAACHDNISREADYVFTDYNGILAAVKPGNPDDSPAYTSLVAVWDEDFMPPDQPLSLENRTLIRLWISQGARYTVCPDTIPDDTTVISRACFQRDIFPVIQSSCALSGCHDNFTAEEGYSFTSYSGILDAVDPGRPDNSELYEIITEDDPVVRMPPPPGDPLPQPVIDSIFAWINYGAPDEDCGVICDTLSEVTFSNNIWPLISRNCLGCHSGPTPSGNVSLVDYNAVSIVAQSGKLIGVLRGIGFNVPMPPAGPLPECHIRQFELWVENGFQNNR